MTVKKKQEKIKLDKFKEEEAENLNNKIFVVILGLIILVLAVFGKTVNDEVLHSYEEIKQNFSLSNDLSYVYETYSVITVDGVVKVKNNLKKSEDLLWELSSRRERTNEKIKNYFESTDCHKQKTLDNLYEKIKISNIYWQKLEQNLQNSKEAQKFCEETLKNGELYEVTDPILKDLTVIMNCHFERVNHFIFKSKKILETFKKVCITSCMIGILLLLMVIFNFIKDEIQKRSVNNISGKRVAGTKRIVSRKKGT